MRIFLSFLLLTIAFRAYPQKHTWNAYVDVSDSAAAGDKYFVIFAAQGQERGKKLEFKNIPGHSWVVLVKQDVAGKTAMQMYGYWPDKKIVEAQNPAMPVIQTFEIAMSRPFFLPNLLAGLFSQSLDMEMRAYFEITKSVLPYALVPGLLKNELPNALKEKPIAQVVFKVNKDQYDAALAVIGAYKKQIPDYALFFNDCISFQLVIAKAMGIHTPPRSAWRIHTWLPLDFVKSFVRHPGYNHVTYLDSCQIARHADGTLGLDLQP